MNQGNHVGIIDRDGWRKEFPLDKPLLHVGSDSRNDINLDTSRGAGVASRHLQLIAVPGEPPGYRAINLADTDILLGDAGDRSLAPRSAIQIADGECIRLGEFVLIFHLGAQAAGDLVRVAAAGSGAVQATAGAMSRQEPVVPLSAAPAIQEASASIGVRLAFPRATVDPQSPLEGMIVVRNLGDEPGAQFRLELEGLHHEWYEMGPGPILFPNVDKGVFLRIRHPRGPDIAAGRREISVCCSAPAAYPGESVTVSQVLEILPYYHHELRVTPTD